MNSVPWRGCDDVGGVVTHRAIAVDVIEALLALIVGDKRIWLDRRNLRPTHVRDLELGIAGRIEAFHVGFYPA